ncbi:DUF1178 family protein [Kordiimonas sp. SCSIO 12610]|uniref:DUF1178 family protein n=1 Tax=Kordiimonas sp. SCSIO 12610 TaxID=2829597 RepID=UPI00210D8B93|nr:DUF1178 family protein [Kordiimonas sp. SCSIO 12610]UTW55741.1 DUF1178 family protein [Kordiimonas sp. SCSIO 12610]
MIVFDLKCNNDHKFEAWFQSSNAFMEQQQKGIVECPFCGSSDVQKAIMAPNVAAKSNQKPEASPKPSSEVSQSTYKGSSKSVAATTSPKVEIPKELAEAAQEFAKTVKKHVEDNCDYVGKEFAEEARKIHYGETTERGIYGEASADETAELIEEGIDILPIPIAPKTDA